jgi:hypothetical protein
MTTSHPSAEARSDGSSAGSSFGPAGGWSDGSVKAGRAAAALLTLTAAFEVGLALGAPWGAAAWGGTHPGVLPAGLRLVSAASLAIYLPLTAIAAGWLGGPALRRRVLRVASGLMLVGVLANSASPSMVEKVWVPVTAALAVLLWRAAPRGRRG